MKGALVAHMKKNEKNQTETNPTQGTPEKSFLQGFASPQNLFISQQISFHLPNDLGLLFKAISDPCLVVRRFNAD
jgi:hypothetical protein